MSPSGLGAYILKPARWGQRAPPGSPPPPSVCSVGTPLPHFFPQSGSIGTAVPTCSTGCVNKYRHTASWMNFPSASFPAALPGVTELCARRASPFTSNFVIRRREFPYGAATASTVVISGPAVIEHVAESKEAIRRRRRGETLPALQLIARTAQHHDAIHALCHRKARRTRRTM